MKTSFNSYNTNNRLKNTTIVLLMPSTLTNPNPQKRIQ